MAMTKTRILRTPVTNSDEPVHVQVLDAARRVCDDATKLFTLAAIVEALPDLNSGTVRTHVSSRCCVNAPDNHQHRWPYFHRVRRGVYRLRLPFVEPAGASYEPHSNRRPLPSRWRPSAKPLSSHPDASR